MRLFLRALLALAIALPPLLSGPAAWAVAAGLNTVKDFGAVGNGIADDTNAFLTGFTQKKILFVPAGTYRVTAQIRIPAGGALLGSGTIRVEWDPVDASNTEASAALRIMGSGARVEGIKIDKKFVDGSYALGIWADNASAVAIRNVEISGYSARYGIHLFRCTDFFITGCLVRDFLMDTTADMISDSPAGIRLTSCVRGVLMNNTVRDIKVGPVGITTVSPLVPAYGVQGYQSDNISLFTNRDVAVTGNYLATSGEGIDILLSEALTLHGNIIRDQYWLGIKAAGASFSTLNGNQIEDCFIGLLGGSSYAGRQTIGNAMHANVIRDSGAPGSFTSITTPRATLSGPHAVYLDAICQYNLLTENVFADSQTSKTMLVAVGGGGATNDVRENIIATNFTHISQSPIPTPDTASRNIWAMLE